MRKETIYSVTVDKDNKITFKVERYSDKKESDHFEMFIVILVVVILGFFLLFIHWIV